MVVYQECITAIGWQEVEVASSNPENPPYLVTIPPWDRGDTTQVSCSCQSYIHRGWCRHQREAYSLICQWSEFDSELEQTEEQRKQRVCPECGGKTHIVVEEDS